MYSLQFISLELLFRIILNTKYSPQYRTTYIMFLLAYTYSEKLSVSKNWIRASK